MITRFLPWKFFIKRTAKRYGIIDPLNLLARVRRFAQPSEVQEPIELLRAGIVFHARGIINARAIQYNLDWVWPYWAEKQFDPNDLSFIPRSFSFSHVNLTHRNWTAVGYPDLPAYPIVDPQGLFTPLFDGWSIDCWIITRQGEKFIPSRMDQAEQVINRNAGLAVETVLSQDGFKLKTTASVIYERNSFYACMDVEAFSEKDAWLVIAVRPYNPEGVQFIENISFRNEDVPFWVINRKSRVYLNSMPEKVLNSSYHEGDVHQKWHLAESEKKVHCGVGMATSAAFFPITGASRKIRVLTNISRNLPGDAAAVNPGKNSWENVIKNAARLNVPDRRIQDLYDTALQTLVLLSAGEVVPGPYTYFRFWFRDACLMINSMLAVNLLDRARSRLDTFPERRKFSGYFQSQEGEWDSNGQVLWIFKRYLDLSGERPSRKWLDAIFKGAGWIEKKRVRGHSGLPHEGLLPAGFSAEHLGPNDYYYWDDFWGVAGLQAASMIARKFDSLTLADRLEGYAIDFEKAIFRTIERNLDARTRGCIPASPYRRMDAGAIGSLVADYPLQLVPAGDERIMNTVNFLIEYCFHKGAFFQDMIHSGINAYLTLDIAQTLLRHGDDRYRELFQRVVELASPTGQWPEAIHPLTGGGCMGDGQHGWAASEFLMMIRNMFVREEPGILVIGSGVFPEWMDDGYTIGYGPTATPFGTVSVSMVKTGHGVKVVIDASWHENAPEIQIRIPGYKPRVVLRGEPGHRLELEVENK